MDEHEKRTRLMRPSRLLVYSVNTHQNDIALQWMHGSTDVRQFQVCAVTAHAGLLYCIVLYCIVFIVSYLIVLYCIVQYRILSYRILSYRIVLYRMVSYCIVEKNRKIILEKGYYKSISHLSLPSRLRITKNTVGLALRAFWQHVVGLLTYLLYREFSNNVTSLFSKSSGFLRLCVDGRPSEPH